jgi:hypothetical protein
MSLIPTMASVSAAVEQVILSRSDSVIVIVIVIVIDEMDCHECHLKQMQLSK